MPNPSHLPPLVIYHAHCDDGFCAAHVAHSFLEIADAETELYPGIYQQEPPDVTGRDVVIVDFSYSRPVMDEICAKARSVLLLDHHKTAIEALSGIATNPLRPWHDHVTTGGVTVMFDNERSGAALAWDYFYGLQSRRLGEPEGKRPRFIEYIQDRDLWRKALPNGDEFTIALRSYPQTTESWDRLLREGPNNVVDRLIAEGHSIQRYYRMRVEEMKRSAYLAIWRSGAADAMDGVFAIANAPYFAASEVAGELCEMNGAHFGAAYFEVSPGVWQYSLRSRGGFDVSEIAKQFGGGGHLAAAGFSVTGMPAHIPFTSFVREEPTEEVADAEV